jgi:hypothetical protein
MIIRYAMRAAEIRDRLESSRSTTLQLVQHLSWEEMSVISSEGRWSPAMVLDHLRQVDQGTAALVGRLAQRARSKEGSAPAPEDIGLSFDVDVVAEVAMRYPVQERVTPQPGVEPDLLDRLAEARGALLLAADDAFLVDCTGYRLPHPILKGMNPYEWLAFTAAHEIAHHSQLRSILEASEATGR